MVHRFGSFHPTPTPTPTPTPDGNGLGLDDFRDTGTGSEGQTAIGRDLWLGDRRVRLINVTSGRFAGKVALVDPATGEILQAPFTGGTFLTSSNQILEAAADGTVFGTPRALPFPSARSSGGGGLSYDQQVGLLGIENEQARDMLRLRHELDLQLEEARAANNRELELELMNRKAEIDRELQRLGFENEMRILDRQFAFESEQQELNRQNQLKQQAISEFGAMQRAVLGVQQQAREFLAQLQGQDPLRAALATRGSVRLGTTPAEGFRRQLIRVANEELPQIDTATASLEEITSATGTLQPRAQLPTPQAPAFLGGGSASQAAGQPVALRGGGVIELGRDQYRVLEDSKEPDIEGPTGIGIEVGERGKEVLEITPDRVRVIPILSRAQGGIEIQLGRRNLGAPDVRQTGVRRVSGLEQPAFGERNVLAAPQLPTRISAPQLALPSPAAPPGIPPFSAAAPAAAPTLAPPAPDLGEQARIAGIPQAAARALTASAGAGAGAGVATPLSTAAAPGQPGQPALATRTTQDFTMTPSEWLQSIIDRWPNVNAQDALVAQQYGAAGAFAGSVAQQISDAILQFSSGTLGEGSALSILTDILGGLAPATEPGAPGAPPGAGGPTPVFTLPPGADVQQVSDFVNDLIATLDSGGLLDPTDAFGAQELGLHDLADLINQVDAGLVEPSVLAAALQGFATTLTGQLAELPDLAEIERAILELWQELDLDPARTETEGGFFSVEGGAPLLGRLGFRPQLLRDNATGQVYLVSGGRVVPITQKGATAEQVMAQLADYGIMPNAEGVYDQIFGVDGNELAGFGAVGIDMVLTKAEIRSLLEPRGRDPFPAWAQPIIEPNTGLLMPAPKLIVGLLRRLDRTNPNRARVIRSAYELAGVNLGDLAARERFFTPSGTAALGGVELR